MSQPPVNFKSSLANNSAAARELQQASSWLNFSDPTLEREFHRSHHQQSRWMVCIHLTLALLLLLALTAMDVWVLHRASSALLNIVRSTVFVALLACIVIVLTTKRMPGYYPRVIQLMAPLVGVAIVVSALIDKPANISYMAVVVLTTLSLYLFVGMRFIAALSVGGCILFTYLVGAAYTTVPLPEMIFDGGVLVFTNIIGVTASYALEKLRRTEFLESRMLTEMVNRDGLTGICNRRAFDEHLNRLWEQALRDQQPIALLLIDIDHFKAFNDCYGHQAGDYCLQKVAATIAESPRRPLDMSARYGGEEFAVLLHNVTREYIESVIGKIQADLLQLGLSNPLNKPAPSLTVSIGVAFVTPQTARSSYGIVQLADEALYAAKAAGRDQVVIRDVEYADLSTGAFRNADNQVRRLGS
ncbi:MAG: GGDEF domain-containing protein [Steroidobacteraceae bacterium]